MKDWMRLLEGVFSANEALILLESVFWILILFLGILLKICSPLLINWIMSYILDQETNQLE